MLRDNEYAKKITFFCIFINGYINHCRRENHNGGKDSLETEMEDDRKSLGKSICLNDSTLLMEATCWFLAAQS